MSGTPKNLREAIENGLEDVDLVDKIEAHVLDWLRQKFSTALLRERDDKVEEALKRLAQTIGVIRPNNENQSQ